MGKASRCSDLQKGLLSNNQVWELDRTLLQQHAAPLVEGYTWETGTLLRALDMDEFLPAQAATGAEAKLGGPRVARRIQRSGRSGLPPPPGWAGWPCRSPVRGPRKLGLHNTIWAVRVSAFACCYGYGAMPQAGYQ